MQFLDDVQPANHEATFDLVDLRVPTVLEYLNWLETYPELLTDWGDLKDSQRPWMIDALRELLPDGGRILDLGGSRCEFAASLHGIDDRYEITVVDPYDGSGNGPTDPSLYRDKFPFLDIVQGYVDEHTELSDFDAVVSISVVEHIPAIALPSTVAGIHQALRPGGFSMHAIDFTCRGVNDIFGWQREHNRIWLAEHGIKIDADKLAKAALDSVDTFYLSPRAYRRWRKNQEYSTYPWRNVSSLNSVCRKRQRNDG